MLDGGSREYVKRIRRSNRDFLRSRLSSDSDSLARDTRMNVGPAPPTREPSTYHSWKASRTEGLDDQDEPGSAVTRICGIERLEWQGGLGSGSPVHVAHHRR